jgi:hypothetical protein
MIKQALGATVPPFLATLAVMLIAWRPWRGARERAEPVRATGLALGIGFLVGFAIIVGVPRWPPTERWQWLAGAALAATVVAAVGDARWVSRYAGMPALALTAACSGALLRPPPAVDAPLLWQVGLAAGIAALALLMQPLAARNRGLPILLALVIASSGSSIVFVQTGFAVLALLAAALAAALGAAAAIGAARPDLRLSRGGAQLSAAILLSMLVIGWFYNQAETPWTSFALLAASPLMLWLAERLPMNRLRPLPAAMARIGPVAVLAAVSVIIAIRASAGEAYSPE